MAKLVIIVIESAILFIFKLRQSILILVNYSSFPIGKYFPNLLRIGFQFFNQYISIFTYLYRIYKAK